MTAAIEIECEIEEELRDLYAGVTVQIMRITPAIARQMLERNKKNRPLNTLHVKNMKDMFLAGDMILNGETIIFDVDGNMLNGQHRLHGCVESGVAWDAIVVRGIDPDAFRTLDSGKKRTTGDTLALCGEVSHEPVERRCAGSPVIHRLRRRLAPHDVRGEEGHGSGGAARAGGAS